MKKSITIQLKDARERIEYLETRVRQETDAKMEAKEDIGKIAKELSEDYIQVQGVQQIIARIAQNRKENSFKIDSQKVIIDNLVEENAKCWLMVRIFSEKPNAFTPDELAIFRVVAPHEQDLDMYRAMTQAAPPPYPYRRY